MLRVTIGGTRLSMDPRSWPAITMVTGSLNSNCGWATACSHKHKKVGKLTHMGGTACRTQPGCPFAHGPTALCSWAGMQQPLLPSRRHLLSVSLLPGNDWVYILPLNVFLIWSRSRKWNGFRRMLCILDLELCSLEGNIWAAPKLWGYCQNLPVGSDVTFCVGHKTWYTAGVFFPPNFLYT